MAKSTLSSLAAGIASRLGQLTVQTAKQARVNAEKVARKSLTKATKLLDEAIEATKTDDVKAVKPKTITMKTMTAKIAAPKSRSTKR